MAQLYTGPTSHTSLFQMSQNALNTVSSYAGQIADTEENYLAQTTHYMTSANNVMQVFAGDYNNNKALKHLEKAERKEDFNNFLDKIGMNNTQNNFNNFTLYSDDNTKITGADLSSKNLTNLKSGAKIDINGVQIGGLNDPVTRQFSNLADKVIDEKVGLGRLSGGKVDKLTGFNDIKQHAISTIQQFDGIKNFNGSRHDCTLAVNSLRSQISKCTDPTKLAELTGRLDLVNAFDKNFAKYNASPNGLSASQKAGAASIGRMFLGPQMMMGINFYRGGAKIASTATRGATNLARNAVMKTTRAVTFTADFLARHTPGLNKFAGLTNATKKAADGTKKADDFLKTRHKENRNAKKSHSKKQLKNERRAARFDKNTNKLRDKTQKLQAKEKLTKGIDSKKTEKFSRKRERNENKLKKRDKKSELGKTFRDRLHKRIVENKFFGKLFAAKEFWRKYNPIKLISGALAHVVNFFKKLGMIGLGALIVPNLIVGALGFIIIMVVKFVSDLCSGTDFAGQLENQNFVQICVDRTETDLASCVLKVFKEDANRKYNVWDYFDGTVAEEAEESDNFDWYKRSTEGKIGGIVASEDPTEELPSLNANIVPITSMMHMRYTDYINFEEYFTCQAYMYYMYVMSHRVYSETIEEVPDCDVVYNTIDGTNYVAIWTPGHGDEIGTLVRGEQLCTNEYLHGYKKSVYKEIAEARVVASRLIYNVLDFLNINIESLNDDTLRESSGVWHARCNDTGNNDGRSEYAFSSTDVLPRDENGNLIEGYTEERDGKLYSLDVTPHDAKGVCDNYIAKQYSTTISCSLETHTHTSKPTTDGSRDGEINGCYKWGSTSVWRYASTQAFRAGTVPANTATTKYDIKRIHFVNGMPMLSVDISVLRTYGAWEFACDKEVHNHSPWMSDAYHGCYDTAYICGGHCGGHLTPVLTIAVDTEYETLMQLDTFMTPTIIPSTGYDSMTSDLMSGSINSYSQYQGAWQAKMMTWLVPGPWSAPDILANLGRSIYHGVCKVVDGLTKWLGGLVADIAGFDVEDQDDDNKIVYVDAAEENTDLYDFEGWLKVDGSINEEALENLLSFYGEKYSDEGPLYETGKANWETIGDVIFSDGMNRRLTDEQILSILNGLSTSDSNKAVLRKALETCGQYWLNESFDGEITQPYGAANPVAWVEYIYQSALGRKPSQTSGDVHPGTALLNDAGNRLCIYIGSIPSEVKNNIFNAGSGGSWAITFDDDGVYLRKISLTDYATYFD